MSASKSQFGIAVVATPTEVTAGKGMVVFTLWFGGRPALTSASSGVPVGIWVMVRSPLNLRSMSVRYAAPMRHVPGLNSTPTFQDVPLFQSEERKLLATSE